MPLLTIPSGNVASATAGGFEVANSCRFNDGDSPELSRSTGDGNEDVGSFSFWWKTAKVPGGATFYSIYVDSSNFFTISVDGGGNFQVLNKLSGSYNMQFESSATYRDPSAWYNFVVLVDTTQAVEANRMKAYVNGTQITSWQTATYPSQNTDMIMNSNSRTAYISHSGDRMHGYLAEFVLIDGTAQAVTDFGEFDEDSPTIWKPKDVSGLTKGVNGFYLDFEDSSALGNCAFGGTDFTVSNLAATDQATDTPTNNFCTMNPLYAATSSAFTFSQGNCEVEQNASDWRTAAGTIGVSSGKWYFEAKGGQGTNGYTHLGWASNSWLTEKGVGSMYEPTTNHNGPAVTYYGANGNNYYSTSSATGSNASYGATWDNGDTIGCFLDLDNNKAYWSKDGTLQNSGTGYSIESGYTWFPVVGGFDMDNGGESVKVNFGGCPATTISSGNTDGSYGNFEYSTTITGDSVSKTFKALCTKNLAEYG